MVRTRAKNGFTFLNLLAALSIGSVVALMCAPDVAAMRSRTALRAEARLLVETVQELSLAAQFRDQEIIFTAFHDRLIACFGGTTTAGQCDPPLMQRRLQRGVAITGGEHRLTIAAGGTVTPGTLTITGSGGRCAVVFALRGRGRIQCGG